MEGLVLLGRDFDLIVEVRRLDGHLDLSSRQILEGPVLKCIQPCKPKEYRAKEQEHGNGTGPLPVWAGIDVPRLHPQASFGGPQADNPSRKSSGTVHGFMLRMSTPTVTCREVHTA